MFNQKQNFLSLLKLPHPVTIRLGDGKTTLSTHGGLVELPMITIQALHVPTFQVSLLSVSKLGAEGLRTTFKQHSCTVKRNQQLLLSGEMKNRIYILRTAHTALITSTSSELTGIETWHRHLAHLNYEYIRNMALPISKENSGTRPCNICILSKHKRTPHRKNPATRATQPFELIHSDSCTITTPPLSGALY